MIYKPLSDINCLMSICLLSNLKVRILTLLKVYQTDRQMHGKGGRDREKMQRMADHGTDYKAVYHSTLPASYHGGMLKTFNSIGKARTQPLKKM